LATIISELLVAMHESAIGTKCERSLLSAAATLEGGPDLTGIGAVWIARALGMEISPILPVRTDEVIA
jgi:hypothetical protein